MDSEKYTESKAEEPEVMHGTCNERKVQLWTNHSQKKIFFKTSVPHNPWISPKWARELSINKILDRKTVLSMNEKCVKVEENIKLQSGFG